jgi:hypothetical protein
MAIMALLAIEYIWKMNKIEFLISMCRIKKATVSSFIKNCRAVEWNGAQVAYMLQPS